MFRNFESISPVITRKILKIFNNQYMTDTNCLEWTLGFITPGVLTDYQTWNYICYFIFVILLYIFTFFLLLKI